MAEAWIAWPLSWSSSTRLPRPPVFVGREDPRRPGRPGSRRVRLFGRPAAHAQREGDGDRRTPGPWQDVVPDAEGVGIGAERAQVVAVQPEQAIGGHERHRGDATRRRPRSGSPRVRSGSDRDRPPGRQDVAQQGLERRRRRPTDATFASTGEPAIRHRSALDRRRRRYGLASPPSPSTTRQTGASASNRVAPHGRVGLGRRAGPGSSADGASRVPTRDRARRLAIAPVRGSPGRERPRRPRSAVGRRAPVDHGSAGRASVPSDRSSRATRACWRAPARPRHRVRRSSTPARSSAKRRRRCR